MAGLASSLSTRAGSLAQRSTADSLMPEPQPGQRPEMAAQADAPNEGRPIGLRPVTEDGQAQPDGSRAVDEMPASTLSTSGPASSPPPSALTRKMYGREGRLEASGERVVRWTLELSPQLVTALNTWERDETRTVGQRVFRERMVDLALDSVPQELDAILALVAELPESLRTAAGEQFGTRVRASVRDKLMNLRPELRVAGIKHQNPRHLLSRRLPLPSRPRSPNRCRRIAGRCRCH